ncbi:MAG: indole-3-glycerol phosphate synthase TrpC [Fusobacteriota bacterium]
MILDDIVKKKRERLKKEKIDLEILKKKAMAAEDRPSFFEAMKQDGISIIGEVKKGSPSKGIIVEDFKPVELAKKYEGCVQAISVLTEEDFFWGSPVYLKDISKNVKLPLLRKDFIVQESQIYEAKIIGASAVLLIASILDRKTIDKFIKIIHNLNMDALVEVHNQKELDEVLKTSAKIIGINNRNLKTFTVDLNNTVKLSKNIPKDKIVIGESGIKENKDIEQIRDSVDGVLIGESFMRSDNIFKKVKQLKGKL